ncbi:MAG: hypothetical protein A2X25_00005 [Chloroflexi bacterium GWB2_49_20]|nr:MAG: hypothetical protein A2X25_00005 [Chloroflexi bacterium GWB2_49_20]OGN76947.1 MAG: hypothetical protein A2X26_13560 [Chloroflexi bacterium GWC2_49_37]OGN84857.1 MAG: hypothetical protein A2X27_14895 [Chloroflexi bacterium GWD2_49_16]HCM96482.1 hypothetical protein [Anaerolineae bacterium]
MLKSNLLVSNRKALKTGNASTNEIVFLMKKKIIMVEGFFRKQSKRFQLCVNSHLFFKLQYYIIYLTLEVKSTKGGDIKTRV